MSDERIIENIRKLKSLGMPDSEIIDNLVNIGLSKEESENLVLNLGKEKKEEKSELQEKIKEIKENPKKKEGQAKKTNNKKPEKEEIPDDFFAYDSGEIVDTPMSDELDDDYDLSSSKELDTLKNISTKSKEEDIDFNIDIKKNIKEDSDLYKKYEAEEQEDLYKKYTINNPPITNTSTNTEEVWQKGLVTTINSKLTELEGKQKSIEEMLKSKIENEINNVRKIQENIQKEITLNTGKIISGEFDKLNTKIITEMAKLKIVEAKTNTKLQAIDQDKDKIKEITKDFELLKKDLKENIIETKKRTDEIISGTEENITKIITTMNIKLNEKIKEINSTLALQSKITEGLVKNTQTTIVTEIKKLNQFQSDIKAQIDPKRIYDKINELEDYKIKLAHRYEERFEKVKVEFLQKAKIAIKTEIENELKELKTIKEEVVSKTDPAKIEKKLQELRKFEEEVINSIDTKIDQSLKIYQASITKEFKDKMVEIENYRNSLEKSKDLQRDLEDKLKEIDRFKKQFIAVIDENIEKMNQNMNILLQQKK